MKIFRASKPFPKEEAFSLTSQMRRSSRSVNANLCEAWRKRRYEAAFISKLSDAETEAAETQVGVGFGVECRYVPTDLARELYAEYNAILSTIVGMINHPETWVLPGKPKDSPPA